MLFADAALARRLEENEAQNLLDHVTTMAALWPGSAARAQAVAGGMIAITGPGSPINRAIGLGLDGPVSEATIEEVEGHFAAAGLPPEIELCPLADPACGARLAARGYGVRRFFNRLVRPLDPREPWQASPTIQVTPVSHAEPDEVAQWIEVAARAFSNQNEGAPAPINLQLMKVAAHRPKVRHFVALVRGEVAGAGAVVIRGSLATLFSTATLPAWRGQGVQTALLQARLAVAAAAGCDLITVMTVPGSASQRNVERAGFHVAYTNLVVGR